MKIVIAGVGKIGESIVKHVCKEGHNVVIVDTYADRIEQMINQYDVMGVVGNAVSYDILKSVDISDCDLFIAVTLNDESNILACLIAKQLGAKNTIARVRNYEYANQAAMMKSNFGLTMLLNPEAMVAEEILRITNFPDALKVDTFANGSADMFEFMVSEESAIIGKDLITLSREFNKKVLIAAVERKDEVIIPNGQFVLEAKDRIHVVLDKKEIRPILLKLGLSTSKSKNVFIIGGGDTAIYLADGLIDNKFNVKIIEQDMERCKELSEALPKASIIFADGSDQRILEEEGMDSSDIVVCLTGSDEENIIVSLYAKSKNIRKVITKISKNSYSELMKSVELSSVITPQEVVASKILSYVRALSNDRGNNVKTLYKLVNDNVEAVEFEASENSLVINKALKDLKLKKNILISGVVREGEVIIPSGATVIQKGDSVLVVTNKVVLNDLDDILL